MVIFAAQAFILFLRLLHVPGTSSVMMTFRSSCGETIWPAIVSKPDSPELPKKKTGFALQPGESKNISAPANWTGMVWARTHCHKDSTTGKFTCRSGDCGSYAVECPGGTAAPAATTLANLIPNSRIIGEYIYAVSLVNGFNLPMVVVPRGKNIINGGGALASYCAATGCAVNLNQDCPKEVQILGHENEIIGCNSACEAFKESQDEYYCGRPSIYSDHFKSFCPLSQTFEDDKTSTIFSCASADYYDVSFCAIHFSFPSTPPLRCYRVSSPEGLKDYDNSTDAAISTTAPWSKTVLYAIIGGSMTGIGMLILGYVIWRYYLSENHSCPSFNLEFIFFCCNHWLFCNCCNSSSSSSHPDDHQGIEAGP